MSVLLLLGLAAPPNMVFLMADDLATSAVGCYGNDHVRTPHINALAAEGLTFDRHYVTTAICMASRASVMTGRYEYRHGCNFHTGPMSEEDWQASYPMVLRRAGYLVAMAGKFGFTVSDDAVGPERGRLPADDFDRWGGGPGQTSYATRRNRSMRDYADDYPHASRAYGAFGADFVHDAAAEGRPFCLSISFKAPHRPVQPDPMYGDWYVGETFPKPRNFGREAGKHLPPQSRLGRQYPRFVDWGYADRYDAVTADYFRLVAGVDAAVGMIRSAIQKAGVAESTVVIFTSDNGYLCGSHGLASKVLPYEESARVPLIIFDPSSPGEGGRSDGLTASIDFLPTLLDYAGVTDEVDRDGVSLRPLIADPTTSVRDSVALIDTWNPRGARSLAVVQSNGDSVRKTIRWPGTERLSVAEESYDLVADGDELHPVPVSKDDLDALEKVVNDWEARAVEPYRKFGEDFRRRR